MKIDAECLRATIEKRVKSIESCHFIEAEFGALEKREGRIQAYYEILILIESLQQEQPEVNLEKEIHRIIRSYFKNPDYDGDFIAEVDWEKSMNECARHFYELGLNARKEE